MDGSQYVVRFHDIGIWNAEGGSIGEGAKSTVDSTGWGVGKDVFLVIDRHKTLCTVGHSKYDAAVRLHAIICKSAVADFKQFAVEEEALLFAGYSLFILNLCFYGFYCARTIA